MKTNQNIKKERKTQKNNEKQRKKQGLQDKSELIRKKKHVPQY